METETKKEDIGLRHNRTSWLKITYVQYGYRPEELKENLFVSYFTNTAF
jgi:hypothetical protein